MSQRDLKVSDCFIYARYTSTRRNGRIISIQKLSDWIMSPPLNSLVELQLECDSISFYCYRPERKNCRFVSSVSTNVHSFYFISFRSIILEKKSRETTTWTFFHLDWNNCKYLLYLYSSNYLFKRNKHKADSIDYREDSKILCFGYYFTSDNNDPTFLLQTFIPSKFSKIVSRRFIYFNYPTLSVIISFFFYL